MSTKSFTEVRKPGRRPTPEEIAAFEETGRAIARERKVTAKAERRETRKAETGEHGNTEISASGSTSSREDDLAVARKGGYSDSQVAVDAESSKSADTETRKAEPVVRLTIDLPESVHTRFKAVCAMTRRKMVDEVRLFIENRTIELEAESRG